jgi:uncharacterized protein (DUF305 family)
VSPLKSLVALTLVTLVGVTGCSNDPDEGGGMRAHLSSSPSSSPSAAVSALDIRFMRAMVPLHRQPVRMSNMVTDAGASRQIQTLARQIRASQLNQLRSITTLLEGWGMRRSGMPMMQGTSPSKMGPGTMSRTQMGRLSRMHGASFDARFLSMMTAHHRAAIAAADREVVQGSDPAARDLARMMAGAQRAELDMMSRMAGR